MKWNINIQGKEQQSHSTKGHIFNECGCCSACHLLTKLIMKWDISGSVSLTTSELFPEESLPCKCITLIQASLQHHQLSFVEPSDTLQVISTLYSHPASLTLIPRKSPEPRQQIFSRLTHVTKVKDSRQNKKLTFLHFHREQEDASQINVAGSWRLQREFPKPPQPVLYFTAEKHIWGADKKIIVKGMTVCHCHCFCLSVGLVVSMEATSWQQRANDDERSLHDGFSRSLQSCYTQRETGGDNPLKCEVNLNLDYLLYHQRQILSEVKLSGEQT